VDNAEDVELRRSPWTGLVAASPVPHNGDMADDEIERLLREVAGATGSEAAKPTRQAEVAPSASRGTGGRLAFAGIAAASMGVIGWGAGLIMPFLGAGSAGIGAACGAFVTALVVGPPRWFSS
jgi:hypothetical protein